MPPMADVGRTIPLAGIRKRHDGDSILATG
jgi:hypothetical protein